MTASSTALAEAERWLRDKVQHQHWSGVLESRSVTHTWSRSVGRWMSATLHASIEPSAAFELLIDEAGVPADCMKGARDGVFSVLLGQGSSPILACRVRLSALTGSEAGMCRAAFHMVAREATLSLLGLTADHSFNVAWNTGLESEVPR